MSEGSLPPFRSIWLRFSPASLIKRPLGRIAGSLRGRRQDTAPDPGLRARAAEVIREYAEAHAAIFERAARLREKADRLDRAGTPSESARNRAARAEREAGSGLAELRFAFATTGGEEGLRAFDLEVESRYPALGIPEAHS